MAANSTPRPADQKSNAKPKAAAKTKVDPLPTAPHAELATLVDAPFDDEDWLFEIKWDGFRALATIHEDGAVDIVSRNGKDFSSRFPELRSLAKSFSGAPAVVDGEIVALDGAGKSSFQLLQNRMGTKAPNIKYVVFDALYAEGRDLRREPLEERKRILARIVRPKSRDVVYSEHVVGKGTELFEAASARGLEGIIAKRRRSPYIEKRTRDWVKIKALLEQECVVAGYTSPEGAREAFGSLVLGVYDQGRLVYCGNVGTGFDAATIRSLTKKLRALATPTCPFARRPKTRTAAHWVAPKLVAQVRFTEWTHDGSMRHPVFLGLRDDKRPRQCRREAPRPTKDVA